jgi:hypothetical protein
MKTFCIFAVAGLMWINYPQTAYSLGVALATSQSGEQCNTSEMKNEIWKQVKGYEGLYEVSNLGNIKSVDRYVTSITGVTRLLKGKLLKHGKTKSGYMNVVLMNQGVRNNHTVHSLVYDAHGIGERNGRKLQVHHIDHDKTNNAIYNLTLKTPQDNMIESRINLGYITPGIQWVPQRNKWQVYTTVNSKRIWAGYYNNYKDALNTITTLKSI